MKVKYLKTIILEWYYDESQIPKNFFLELSSNKPLENHKYEQNAHEVFISVIDSKIKRYRNNLQDQRIEAED